MIRSTRWRSRGASCAPTPTGATPRTCWRRSAPPTSAIRRWRRSSSPPPRARITTTAAARCAAGGDHRRQGRLERSRTGAGGGRDRAHHARVAGAPGHHYPMQALVHLAPTTERLDRPQLLEVIAYASRSPGRSSALPPKAQEPLEELLDKIEAATAQGKDASTVVLDAEPAMAADAAEGIAPAASATPAAPAAPAALPAEVQDPLVGPPSPVASPAASGSVPVRDAVPTPPSETTP